MSTFYIILPWVALFIAMAIEIHFKSDSVVATLSFVVAVIVLALVSLGAKLGGVV